MNFIVFKKLMQPFQIFSINDIKKFDSNFDSRRLYEWQEKEYLKKIANRWYVLDDKTIDENMLFYTANKIYKPSYVSFHTALSFYGLIPEGVFSITSATTVKTNTLHTRVGTFVYHHIKPSLFFGYKLLKINDFEVIIAEMEKCILDFFYINSPYKNIDDFKELRINKHIFNENINKSKFYTYLSHFQTITLEKRVNLFFKFIEND